MTEAPLKSNLFVPDDVADGVLRVLGDVDQVAIDVVQHTLYIDICTTGNKSFSSRICEHGNLGRFSQGSDRVSYISPNSLSPCTVSPCTLWPCTGSPT